MEDPVAEIPTIIHLLTQTPPSTQLETLNKYYLPSASFTHPFCRTGSWDLGDGWNSRWAMSRIYRWYKIMSPTIDLEVNSVAYDSDAQLLYVSIQQNFRIIALPGYSARVSLVAKLSLTYDRHWRRHYIAAQEDLYQATDCFRFLWFGVWYLWLAWQFAATAFCVLGAWLGGPVSWAEERWSVSSLPQGFEDEMRRWKREKKVNSIKGDDTRNGGNNGTDAESPIVKFKD